MRFEGKPELIYLCLKGGPEQITEDLHVASPVAIATHVVKATEFRTNQKNTQTYKHTHM